MTSTIDENIGAMSQNIGAIVVLTAPKEGSNVWNAQQINLARNLPPGDVLGRKEIKWSFGPVTVTGYLDTNTLEIGVNVEIIGINVGNIYGNLNDGVGLTIDLFVAKGEIKFYLKHGNELWVHLNLKITFDGTYKGDYKIMSF